MKLIFYIAIGKKKIILNIGLNFLFICFRMADAPVDDCQDRKEDADKKKNPVRPFFY